MVIPLPGVRPRRSRWLAMHVWPNGFPQRSPATCVAPALGVPKVNLDRALQLAAELEDEELVHKSRVGK